MVSVQIKIEIQGDLNLVNISQKLDEVNVPKEILRSVIVKVQKEIILDLCGPKYARGENRKIQASRNHR